MERLRGKLAQGRGKIPKETEEPVLQQFRVNDQPIMSIRLSGSQDLLALSQLAESIEDRFTRLPGVNNATVSGERKDIVRVRLIGARMDALGISATQIANVLNENNLNMPWGQFDGEDLGAVFRFQGRFDSVEQIRNLPVKRGDTGRIIRLSELAEVSRALAQERVRTSYSAAGGPYQTAVDVTLTKQSGADTVAVIDAAKAVLVERRASDGWPEGVEYHVVTDESVEINSNFSGVISNGWQAMLAVFAVLFVSLTWREALVAGIAVPVTFAGALIVVSLIGYTMNQMVIVGMVIALGLLVDVFILMMEGIHDAMFVRGKKFSEATMHTVRTYAAPAIAGTLTTAFAMAPLIGIEGTVGKFIRVMPVTAIVCLVMALVVALLLAIPLSRYILPKPGAKVQKTRVDVLTERLEARLRRLLLAGFIRSRWISAAWIVVAFAVFAGALTLFRTLPSELIGKTDGQDMGILVELEADASMETAQTCADSVGQALRPLPFFSSTTKYVGQKSPFSTLTVTDYLSITQALSYVGFTGTFLPPDQRPKLAYAYEEDIRDAIKPALLACPGGRLQLAMPMGDASPASPIQILISGSDMDQLRAFSAQVQRGLDTIEGARNIRDNLGLVSQELVARPRMEALNFHKITVQDLASQVRYMTGSEKVGKFVVGGVKEDIDIRMGFAWPDRKGEIGGPTTMGEAQFLNVVTSNGYSVPLTDLADFTLTEAAQTIIHKGGQRALTVMADVTGRTAGEILADFMPALEAMQSRWPDGYYFRIEGEAADAAEAFGSAGLMLVLSVCLVFALLVLQFDSFVQPMIIMLTIPLALTGTFFGFFALHLPFSFMAMVGIISLIGIVVNDAIVMIDTMNRHMRAGMDLNEAAAKGAADRLRPIVTTSVTTIVGMIPLSLSNPFWLPLGVTIITGLAFSTVLALLIVPCLFKLLTRARPVEAAA